MVNGRIRILLVEDTFSDAKLISRWFEQSDFVERVTHVIDGESALDHLRNRSGESRVDLVLLDLNLPRMTGLEVLASARNDALMAAIPIVVLSGSRNTRETEKALELRANLCVPKPSDADEFEQLVVTVHELWTEIHN